MEHNDNSTVADSSSKWLPHLASFIAVVEAGSFTAAAKRAGVDKAVLSRRVQKLEEVLAVRLLLRTTRTLQVTAEGRALIESAARPLADATAALRTVREDRVIGKVRVSTMPGFASIWSRAIRRLAPRYPELEIELSVNHGFVDLVADGADMALSSGILPDSSQIARTIAKWRYSLIASPEYLEAHPNIRQPTDLIRHWLLYGEVAHARNWRFERGEEQVAIQVEPRVVVDNSEVLRQLALDGLGITAMPPFFVLDALSSGRLVRVLPDWEVAHVHRVYTLVPHRAFVPARVQAVSDAVEGVIRELAIDWGT